MNSETKSCQNCQKDFTIEPDDFAFYEKMKVPAPTFCPECRLQRRLAWRNEKSFYERTCGLCEKAITNELLELLLTNPVRTFMLLFFL